MSSHDNPQIGSSLDDLLKEEAIHVEARATALKRVLAFQIEQAMRAAGLTKAEMARRMKTSRSQLDRLLDPDNSMVQLDTIQKAANAVDRDLRLELV